MRALHVTVSCVALATYLVSGITSAQAACVASAAAASQTDASTSQALEAVRDRRMQVAQSCPAGSAPGANGMCVPVAGSATVTSASTPNAQPPGQPQAKKAGAAAAAPAPGAPYGSLKDGPAAAPLKPLYGIWAEGYGDYDEHRGPSVRYTSYGVLSGVDHTYFRASGEGILIGGFAGYNETKGKIGASADTEARSQDIQGAMLGLYGTYFHRGFALDVIAKTDLFDFDQRGLECGQTTASTDLTNYVVAANAYFHHRLGSQHWWEPMVGLRYVDSQFGNVPTTVGLHDGNALRLQAGVRVGSDWVSADRRLWSVSFLTALYSDVVVNGFALAGTPTLAADEGRLRALGQLRAKVTTSDGVSYYVQAEARGGEDYWGVGGKAGVRLEW